MTGTLQPLDNNFAIVDPRTGLPTLYFIQWAQQRQIDISEGISAAQAKAIVQQFLTDHPLIEGNGITLAPSGDIGAGVTISADVQEILDSISTAQGTILFRGATDWQALAPGTTGQFLQTAGAGADPLWAAGGGGGGGGGGSAIADLLHAELAKFVALNPVGNLPQGSNIDKVKDDGGFVGLLFYANTLSGAPVAGTTYTVPAGYVAVCIGGHADIQIQQNGTFYKHRLYNVTTGQTVAGFEGGAYNRGDGWRIQYSGIMTSSSGGNPNNVSFPIVGVAGDVLRCEANTNGDGNYRLQCAEYYLAIVNATTGELYPTPGGGGTETEFAMNSPSSAGFTVNAGAASGAVQDTAIGMELHVVQGGGQRGVALTRALPATPFCMTVRFNAMAFFDGELIQGICVRNAAGALVTFYQYSDGRFYGQRWNDQSNFAGNIASGVSFFPFGPIARYYALSIDAAGLITTFYSNNGIRFFPFFTENVATFLGAATGVGMHLAVNNAGGNEGSMHIPYFRIENGVTVPSPIF